MILKWLQSRREAKVEAAHQKRRAAKAEWDAQGVLIRRALRAGLQPEAGDGHNLLTLAERIASLEATVEKLAEEVLPDD